jgi:hypothetical protein
MVSGNNNFNFTQAFDEMFAGKFGSRCMFLFQFSFADKEIILIRQGESKRWKYGVGIKKEFKGKHALHYTQVLTIHNMLLCTNNDCVFEILWEF